MKTLIGTLHSGENEFDECCAAIQNQSYQRFDHFVISGLPNREAHHALYSHFMKQSDEYDLMIKIDADMVLARVDFLEQVVDTFLANRNLQKLQVWVHDFYTNRLIGGLNCFRNTVEWEVGEENVFVDITERYDRRKGSRITDRTELAPAAYHCPNPSNLQAFHFGVHKGVKVVEAINRGWTCKAIEHCENISEVWRNFRRTQDIRLLFATLGAEQAIRGKFGVTHLDYSNSEIVTYCESVEIHDARGLSRFVRKLRRSGWAFLSPAGRVDVLANGAVRYFRRLVIPLWMRRRFSKLTPTSIFGRVRH